MKEGQLVNIKQKNISMDKTWQQTQPWKMLNQALGFVFWTSQEHNYQPFMLCSFIQNGIFKSFENYMYKI